MTLWSLGNLQKYYNGCYCCSSNDCFWLHALSSHCRWHWEWCGAPEQRCGGLRAATAAPASPAADFAPASVPHAAPASAHCIPGRKPIQTYSLDMFLISIPPIVSLCTAVSSLLTQAEIYALNKNWDTPLLSIFSIEIVYLYRAVLPYFASLMGIFYFVIFLLQCAVAILSIGRLLDMPFQSDNMQFVFISKWETPVCPGHNSSPGRDYQSRKQLKKGDYSSALNVPLRHTNERCSRLHFPKRQWKRSYSLLFPFVSTPTGHVTLLSHRRAGHIRLCGGFLEDLIFILRFHRLLFVALMPNFEAV